MQKIPGCAYSEIRKTAVQLATLIIQEINWCSGIGNDARKTNV